MRFCQAFILELYATSVLTVMFLHDIGAGGREVGYVHGTYKKLARENTGVHSQARTFYSAASRIRPEATGFGALYYTVQMLADLGTDIKGKTIAISGFPATWRSATKATQLGGARS